MDVDENDTSRRVIGTTVNGKQLAVYLETQGYYKVKFMTGGQLPADLQGRYLNYQDAENAVKLYLHVDAQKKPVASKSKQK